MTLRLNSSTSGYTEIDAPAVGGNNTLRLPTSNGTSGYLMQTDGAGNLSWRDPTGLLTPFRNRIINGALNIDQRATTVQTFTAGAALAYDLDRWYGYCTGANVTGQRTIAPTAGQFRYEYTGAASVTGIGFGQRIEQLNSADLAGSTATLSVDLANSLLTTVTWTAYYATTADAFGTLASPTRTQIATGTFTVTSTVTRYNTNISIPAAATTGIEIVLTVAAQTSGTWTIGNVQLEPGSVATPFERRSFGQELALCQRYFVSLDRTSNSIAGPWGAFYSTTGCRVWRQLPVPMRTTPTLACTGLVFERLGLGTTTAAQLANVVLSPEIISFDGISCSPSTDAFRSASYYGRSDVSAEL